MMSDYMRYRRTPFPYHQFVPSQMVQGASIPFQAPIPMANTLHIGNLQLHTTEIDIQKLFRSFGFSCGARIERDSYTKVSRRFGFVFFQSPEEAKNAKEKHNYSYLDGAEIRLSFQREKREFQASNVIFIRGLPISFRGRDLENLCSEFGTVLSVILRYNDNGVSCRYGTVQFSTEESAQKALAALNEKEIDGSILQPEAYIPSHCRPRLKTNIYIKNFPAEWNSEKLRQMVRPRFEKFGTIKQMAILEREHSETHETCYFACIAFEKEDEAKAVITAAHEQNPYQFFEEPVPEAEPSLPLYAQLLLTKRQRMAERQKRAFATPTINLIYIRSLSQNVTKEQLVETLSKYGEILQVFVPTPKAHPNTPGALPPMKHALVKFKESESALDTIYKAKTDKEVLSLLAVPPKQDKDFINFFQPAVVRRAYRELCGRGKNVGVVSAAFDLARDHILAFAQSNTIPNKNHHGSRRFQTRNYHHRPYQHVRRVVEPLQKPRIVPAYDLEWLKTCQEDFKQLPIERQKFIAGNLIHTRLLKTDIAKHPNLAKIVGMLSDVEIIQYDELIELLESEEALQERVMEAIEVIESPENPEILKNDAASSEEADKPIENK